MDTTISQVSKSYGISTRMLRYYEQIGLIESFRRDDYAYRMYNEAAISRLRQIIILRKLRISLKQIKVILQKPDAVTTIQVFEQNIKELDEEIIALSAIKDVLSRFVDELQKTANMSIHCLLEQDISVLSSIKSLSSAGINFKENKTMDEMIKADRCIPKLSDVRIVYLPPATIAAAHHIGDEPEYHAITMIGDFVQSTGLCSIKPDLRNYGFNHPNPIDETGYHGYETWVTIPDDMQVPPPLTRKHFPGGLYAAHMIAMGNFNEWEWLFDWVNKNEKYDFAGDLGDQEHMCGLLEEHLNYLSHVHLNNIESEDFQLDLLMPIKERSL